MVMVVMKMVVILTVISGSGGDNGSCVHSFDKLNTILLPYHD